MTCHVFSAAATPAGPCAVCGERYGQAHFVDGQRLTCSACCPIHGRQVSIEWDREEVETVKGKQEALF